MQRKGHSPVLLLGMRVSTAIVGDPVQHSEKKKKLEYSNHILQQIQYWVYTSRWNQYVNIATPLFITALFTVATIWNQPKCPRKERWEVEIR